MEIRPFVIDVPQGVLDDLSARLGRTRWPDEVEDAGWDYGANLAYLRALVEYWRTRFDWRAEERAMNAAPHFRADVAGTGVHFIHVRGARGRSPAPLPLLVTHGWPSSFVEMLPLIPLLADPGAHGGDPADAFDVVVPSVPGFGFSDRPTTRGMTRSRVAGLWAELMAGLGYPRFAAHGNDIGAVITGWMAHDFPDRLIAIHTMMPGFPGGGRRAGRPPAERRRASARGSPVALGARRRRLQPHPGDAAADPGLRAPRLSGRTGRLDHREVAGLDRPGG
jgi:pimeloyl-ACP methyl ester carboxylesterase